jgi:hypothetical protein
LRETGVVESCTVERAPANLARIITRYLEERRYRPVEFRGAPVPVAYEFTVTLSLLPSDARSEFRRAIFEFLADQAIQMEGDAGSGELCLVLGQEEPFLEAAAIRRPGWQVVPPNRCEPGSGVRRAYAQLIRFHVLADRGTAEASVGATGGGGDHLKLTVERADAGWQFRIDERSSFEE